MRYRKKPVVIEAFQYGYDVEPEWFKDFKDKRFVPADGDYDNKFPPDVMIETLEGNMRAPYYSYIIRGVKGEIYPCRTDIFEETYERIDHHSSDYKQ